jgi:hypothetical protein
MIGTIRNEDRAEERPSDVKALGHTGPRLNSEELLLSFGKGAYINQTHATFKEDLLWIT